MSKLISSVCGILCYLVGLGGLSAFMLFMGGWSFLPIHINSRPLSEDTGVAIAINLAILLLFALHHSIAARSSFKEKITQFISPALERSLYVLVSGLFMLAFCFYWQPVTGVIWHTENEFLVSVLRGIHIFGWLFLVAATFEIDHFHLMGLKQSISMNPNEGNQFKEVCLYKIVRHPIQTGILLGMWATPYMSMTQFMLSLGFTIYIFIGLYFEEKSLIHRFGDVYMDYKRRVPAVVPFLKIP
ncbi:methyltransferase family protein [Pseudoalteromonas sp. SSDWG2]|uniref:methyltransferase family protein n=1 Tax=Pseudoalteromonas sp. SSDWG2 TaxID=3139391 RepID=UPI003BACCC89